MQDSYTAKQIAEMTQAFLETEFGQYYLEQMNLQYNGWHQQAEGKGLEPHAKATFVDNAAGLKYSITWLTGKQKLAELGYHEELPDKQ